MFFGPRMNTDFHGLSWCFVCCLLCVGAVAPLAPGRGEGPGVRGEDHRGAAVLSHG